MGSQKIIDRKGRTASPHPQRKVAAYSSRIIKASALLSDTKTLLANWDGTTSLKENLDRFRRDNLFGKASRSRVEDVLAIFRQRYLTSEPVTKALVALVRNGLPQEAIDKILFFHAARADLLLHDVVTEVLAPMHAQGRTDLAVGDIRAPVARWVEEGKTTSRWSEETTRRVVQGLLATLRDFGVLQGAATKRIAPSLLPIRAFAYVAFSLSRSEPSGARLIASPEWRLFFLPPEGVERFLVEANQHDLLEYHAAGTIVRIRFPAESPEEYADVLARRAH
jgi:hypothetical protein